MDSVLKSRHSRRSILAAAGGASALALAGLPRIGAARAQATPDASIEASITYGFWDASQQAAVEAQIKAFNVHFPNISVEPQIVPWDSYWTKLQTSVAGGEAFDVFWLNSASCPVYASKNALVPIDDLIGAGGIDTSVFPAPLVEMYSYKDVQYGLPRDFDTIALFYNKDLFDAAGVDYPTDAWTWDDFRANAEKLTNKDKGIWGAGMQTSWQENYYNFIWQNEGRLLNDDRTVSLVDEPAACEAFEYLTGFFTDELTPSIAIQQSNAVADTLFPAGQVAMMTGGSFRAGTYGKADANLDVAPLPQGKKRATAIHGLANVIWTGSKSQDARQGVRQVDGGGRGREGAWRFRRHHPVDEWHAGSVAGGRARHEPPGLPRCGGILAAGAGSRGRVRMADRDPESGDQRLERRYSGRPDLRRSGESGERRSLNQSD